MTVLAKLQRSPFLDDLTPDDRRVSRVLLTLPLGVVAALLTAVIAGLLVFLVFLFGAGLGEARLMDALRGRVPLGGDVMLVMFVLALLAATNGGMAAAFTAVAARLHHRRLRSYVTAAPRFRWRLTLLGLALFAAGIGPLLLLSVALDPKTATITAPILTISPSLEGRAAYAVGAVVLLLLAAAAEELLFRGWMLKVLGAYTRSPWVLMIVSAAAFSAVHFDPNLDANLIRAAMGVGLAWSVLRLGGIEFAIGAHAANNILILLFLQPMSLKPEPPHAFPLEVLILAPLILAGYVAMAEIAARWTPLRRWSQVAVA